MAAVILMLSCLLLSLMLAGAASGSNVEKRILGGVPCSKTEGKYHVKVSWDNDLTPCGASLLNNRWVLTAARCGSGTSRKLKVDFAAEGWASTIKALFVSNEQLIDIKQQYFYNIQEKKKHDIMLIKLSKAVSSKLATIELPPMAHPPQEAAPEEAAPEEAAPEEAAPEEAAPEEAAPEEVPQELVKHCTSPDLGRMVQIGGWGNNGGKKDKKEHRCAKTKITKCQDKDKKRKNHATTLMCAHNPGVLSCEGDAGSAMVYNNQLYGIIVNNPGDECTNVSEILDICFYLDWITKTMRDNP